MYAPTGLRGRLFLSTMFMFVGSAAIASDHGDVPILTGSGRHDGRISDLFAFQDGSNMVLIVCMNPAIPPAVMNYQFPSDLTLTINIDNDSSVSFNNPGDMGLYGGTVDNPGGIQEDIVFTFTFNAAGIPLLSTSGLPQGAPDRIELFTGLRDDPFIRGPQIGKDIAAIVMRMPKADLMGSQSTLLLWATSNIDDFVGPFQEYVGRSLRSQQSPYLMLNAMHPSTHLSGAGMVPDVMIYDTSRPALFPNGRQLDDDVVDMVYAVDPALVQGVMNTDAPFPSANDKPFMPSFPYLAPPHRLGGSVPAVSTWSLLALVVVLGGALKLAFAKRGQSLPN